MNRYFVDHIPKTGGTALHNIFSSVLGSEKVSPLILFKRLSQVIGENDHFQLVQGHFRFLPGDRLPVDRLAATLLRDPIDRCLSAYFFNRLDVPVSIGSESKGIELARSLSLAEYVSCKDPSVLDYLDNYQARHFFPLNWDGVSTPADDRLLAMAVQSLEEYDLVGVHESFSDFVDVLCYRWSLPRVDQVPRIKVTSSRPSKRDVSPGVLKKLRALNELDIELYETAKELFEKKRRSVIKSCIGRSMLIAIPLEPEGGISTNVGKESASAKLATYSAANFGNHKVKFSRAEITGRISLGARLFCREIVDLKMTFTALVPIDDLTLGISIVDELGRLVFGTNSRHLGVILSVDSPGEFYIEFSFQVAFGTGGYWLGASLHRGESHLEECYHWVDRLAFFEVVGKIGNHFEGTVCLHPMIAVDEGQAAKGLISTDFPCDIQWQHVTAHTPVLSTPEASFRVANPPTEVGQNEVFQIQIYVSNTGSELWVSGGQRPVRVCYHWLNSSGEVLVHDGERTSLPWDIGPGEKLQLATIVRAPDQVGNFVLRITLVQENGVWFDTAADSFLDLSVSVQPANNGRMK